MVSVLMVGDSELAVFRDEQRRLEDSFGIRLTFHIQSGRSLINVVPDVRRVYTGEDIVFVNALTCLFWKKTPLITGQNVPQLVTKREGNDWLQIKDIMQEIVEYCEVRNPSVRVYLILPSLKDMYRFNLITMEKTGTIHLRRMIERNPLFSRTSLSRQMREVWGMIQQLKTNAHPWTRKRFLMGSHAFNNFFQGIPHCQYPHKAFLDNRTEILGCEELLSDGLHYTPAFVGCFFKSIVDQPEFQWLKWRCPVAHKNTQTIVNVSSQSCQTEGGVDYSAGDSFQVRTRGFACRTLAAVTTTQLIEEEIIVLDSSSSSSRPSATVEEIIDPDHVLRGVTGRKLNRAMALGESLIELLLEGESDDDKEKAAKLAKAIIDKASKN